MKSTLKEQTKRFLGSKQNYNLLLKIFSSLYSKGGPDLLQSVRCFQSIFNEIIQRGDFNYEVHAVGSPEYEYSQWLRERYIEGIEILTEIMQTNGSAKLRDIGIHTLFSFNELEYENAGKFPKIDHSLVVRLIEAFLQPVSQLIENSAKLCEFLKSFKVRIEFTHSLKNILEVCSQSTTKPQEEWMRNVLNLCRTILKAETSAAESSTVADGSSKDTVSNEKQHFKRVFSKLWSFVMKWDQMTPVIVRQIVTMLSDYFMEHLDRPILMSNFLLESFKMGGPIGTCAFIEKPLPTATLDLDEDLQKDYDNSNVPVSAEKMTDELVNFLGLPTGGTGLLCLVEGGGESTTHEKPGELMDVDGDDWGLGDFQIHKTSLPQIDDLTIKIFPELLAHQALFNINMWNDNGRVGMEEAIMLHNDINDCKRKILMQKYRAKKKTQSGRLKRASLRKIDNKQKNKRIVK